MLPRVSVSTNKFFLVFSLSLGLSLAAVFVRLSLSQTNVESIPNVLAQTSEGSAFEFKETENDSLKLDNLTDGDVNKQNEILAGQNIILTFPTTQQISRVVIKSNSNDVVFTATVDDGSGKQDVASSFSVALNKALGVVGQTKDTGYLPLPGTVKVLRLVPNINVTINEIEFYRNQESGSNLFFTMRPSFNSGNGEALPVKSNEVQTWSNQLISAIVPGQDSFYGPVLNAPTSQVTVKVLGQTGNSLDFTQTPFITSVSPSAGPVGTWVTIKGRGFGSNGKVQFCGQINPNDPTDCQFANIEPVVALPVPTYCPNPWTETEIIVKVPGTGNWPINTPRYVQVVSSDNSLSSKLQSDQIFLKNTDPLGPRICAVLKKSTDSTYISTTSVKTNDQVTVLGEGFNATSNGLLVNIQSVNAPAGLSNLSGVTGTVTTVGTISNPNQNIVISEENYSGEVSVISQGIKKSTSLYCPLNTNSGSVTFTGRQHRITSPSSFFSDGPTYPLFNSSVPGLGNVTLTGAKADSSVSFRAFPANAAPNRSGNSYGNWIFPTTENIKLGNGSEIFVTVKLFHFGFNLVSEVPVNAKLSEVKLNGVSVRDQQNNPVTQYAKRDINYEINLIRVPNEIVKTQTGKVPANGEIINVVANFGSVPAGDYFIEVKQLDDLSFTCATCSPGGTARNYKTNLALQSLTINTINGLVIEDQCLDNQGRVVQKQPIDLPVTLISNSLSLVINEADNFRPLKITPILPEFVSDTEQESCSQNGQIYSGSSICPDANLSGFGPVCSNGSLVIQIQTPCPLGSVSEPNSSACLDPFGNYVDRLPLAPDSFSTGIRLLRSATNNICTPEEQTWTSNLISAYNLAPGSQNNLTTYCETPTTISSKPIKNQSNSISAYELTVTPKNILNINSDYFLLVTNGRCAAGNTECQNRHQVNGLTLLPNKVQLTPNQVRFNLKTKPAICRVGRIVSSPSNLNFLDSVTPISLQLTGYSSTEVGQAGDQPLLTSFSSVLDSSADTFTKLTESDCVATGEASGSRRNCLIVYPNLSGAKIDGVFTGKILVKAVAGNDLGKLNNPESSLEVPITASACDLPWSFNDKDLNFKASYCTGRKGSTDNLPVLGSGPGVFDNNSTNGAIIKKPDLNQIKSDTASKISTFLKEYLFPVSPNLAAGETDLITTLAGSARYSGLPQEGCNDVANNYCNLSGYQGRSSDSFFTLNGRQPGNGGAVDAWPAYRFTRLNNGRVKIIPDLDVAFSDMSQSLRCSSSSAGSLASRYQKSGIDPGQVFDPKTVSLNILQATLNDRANLYTGQANYRVWLEKIETNGSTLINPVGSNNPYFEISADLTQPAVAPNLIYDLSAGTYQLRIQLTNWIDSSWANNSNSNTQAYCGEQPLPVIRYGLVVNKVQILPVSGYFDPIIQNVTQNTVSFFLGSWWPSINYQLRSNQWFGV